METHGLSNSDVVAAAPGLVTHKMLNKARRGRRLSRKVQLKVQEAFNGAASKKAADSELSYGFDALFNYDGR